MMGREVRDRTVNCATTRSGAATWGVALPLASSAAMVAWDLALPSVISSSRGVLSVTELELVEGEKGVLGRESAAALLAESGAELSAPPSPSLRAIETAIRSPSASPRSRRGFTARSPWLTPVALAWGTGHAYEGLQARCPRPYFRPAARSSRTASGRGG